jgi:hypothetical protein
MRLYKAKIEKTVFDDMTKIENKYDVGYALKVQAVFFGSTNPSATLSLYDADGDEFMFSIPGQAIPRVTTPEIPISVKLPIHYTDSEGNNKLMVFGEVYQIEQTLTTTF